MKSTLIIAFTIFTSTLFAQTSRTIEVTVSDTVFLKTTKIKYLMSLDTTMNYWNMYEDDYYGLEEYMDYEPEPVPENENDKKQKRRNKEEIQNVEGIENVERTEEPYDLPERIVKPEKTYLSRADIIEILNKNKFEHEIHDHMNYELGGEPSKLTFSINLDSEQELYKLYELFSGHEEISGKISELEYESIESKMSTVYKSLYDKALKETMIIAKISGLTVDKVSKVYEAKGVMDNYMDYYQDILNDLPYGIKEPKDLKGREKMVERTFVFDVK